MSITIVKQNRKTEYFGVKVDMLGLSLERQVELLNHLYTGKLHFVINNNMDATCNVCIELIDKSICVLELPEYKEFDFNNLYSKAGRFADGYVYERPSIKTLKLPKCARKFKIDYGSDILLSERVFAWDDCITNIEYLKDIHLKNLKMLIMQYTDGRKPVIYRF